MQRLTPKLQWEGTGLTRHCLSCYARLCKLSAGPPIAAFDLRRLKSGYTPHIRVTQQAESVMGSGGRRLKPFFDLGDLQMEYKIITAVGIDVSKGKSTVAVRRPGGEVVLTPFQVNHDAAGLSGLVKTLRDVGGDLRIVMEHTGMYWRPIALALKEAGFFVSVVNAMLIHDFSDNSLRKVKTDKADSMKIANYALSFWAELRDYSP